MMTPPKKKLKRQLRQLCPKCNGANLSMKSIMIGTIPTNLMFIHTN